MKHSLHMGLNVVNPAFYGGWRGKLTGAVHDAKNTQTLMKSLGFSTKLLTNYQATYGVLVKEIKRLSFVSKAGDIVVISYSGHGGSVKDTSEDETDGKDETLCLYNGQVLDDVINKLFRYFSKDVNVIFISDSCHSQTNLKLKGNRSEFTIKSTPANTKGTVYKKNIIYPTPFDLKCNLVGLAGCKDGEYSYDGSTGGVFTNALIKTFANQTIEKWLLDSAKEAYNIITPQNPQYTEYQGNIKSLKLN